MSGGAAASPGAGAAKIKNCKEAKNVEAIVDDSGSMASSDPSRLRASLVDVIAGLSENSGKKLGGVEFASDASLLFAPTAIGSSGAQAALAPALALLNDDGSVAAGDSGGSTNYNAGFTTGTAANPSADARIFLSDGVPNDGGAPAAHIGGPKTYVVGFDAAVTTPSLAQIAADTGGRVFAVNTAAEILPIAGSITGLLNCKSVQTFIDEFISQGQSAGHKFKATGKTAEILTTWPASLTNMTITITQPGAGAGASASIAAVKKGKGKIKGKKGRGPNFTSFKAKGLRKGGKYKIKIKAKKLGAPTTATTQVIK